MIILLGCKVRSLSLQANAVYSVWDGFVSTNIMVNPTLVRTINRHCFVAYITTNY